jgi:hypothetical protein
MRMKVASNQLGDRNIVMKRDECVQSYSCTPCVSAGPVQRHREFTAGSERLLCGMHFYRRTDWSWPGTAGRRSIRRRPSLLDPLRAVATVGYRQLKIMSVTRT